MPERRILFLKRGRHQKAEKRTNCIMLRLTDSELAIVSEQANQLKQPLAVYVRENILYSASPEKASIHFDLSEFRPVVTEFSRIGNNLNQIAKYYNSGGIKSQEMESEIRRCIKQLFQLREDLMKLEGKINGSIKAYLK